jgi:4-hydroxymandelate oxidase
VAAPINLRDYEALARERLPKFLWDFIEGGAEDELTIAENLAAFRRIHLRPRVLVDVSRRDLSTTVLGQPISMPVMVGPASMQRAAHAEGELATARAAGAAGTLAVFSAGSFYSIRQIAAAASGPLWFQLYPLINREATARMVANAEAAGCKAIVLTVTAFYGARRERHIREPLVTTPEMQIGNLAEVGYPDVYDGVADPMVPLTWADMEWVRSLSRLPLVLKGVLTPEDADTAIDHGVEAIIVSNHGGRQIDGVLPAIEALPEIAERVAGRIEVLMDGGVRRGTDVLKALALGARAVLLGRPILWGLGVAGEAGVARVLGLLRGEIDNAMAQLGVPDVKGIGRSLVRLAR